MQWTTFGSFLWEILGRNMEESVARAVFQEKQIKNKLKYLLECCWARIIKSTEGHKNVFLGPNKNRK